MTKLFVSLPVTDLERTRAFYTAIGLTLNEQMSDDNSACFLWDDIALMLLKREFMASFTDKEIADPATTAQVQVSFMLGSREEVDRTADAGVAAGGKEHKQAEDHGFMYTRDVEDPDGNVMAFMWAADQG